ncbi:MULTISPECIES: 16S rRNA (guanine(527)-N(7))-methyltransferase RsmG [unclassified Aureimonas]|uniref:16S rRNA (guanine(527)-N(7))-methyltransferase RsmG n=1 Tax=unclassified Aureimonas TaxID=2615206 RepID=UPI0006F58879|nr:MULTISPECIES: 16S rRNA (guanine(527)-N(7))-methyltransferase RsmG [unclassified Aureimonas]KQT52588.1 16S rRNA (guanine(527)-N(7))-methyltransferase RsmG [Aureimonas sp. Leaf427]KQT77511.1 16S rRNA (guanine(527)-N(7))-methyltransferase RsmG [Aureimonas sp. Leaf460]
MPLETDGGRAAVQGRSDVSRETLERLDRYVDLLTNWQAKTNLVAPSTLPFIWTRHIADSLQFASLAPKAQRWVDIGSGGGFPGLVTAILLKNRDSAEVHLVESTEKKAAFLRLVIRELGLPAKVHAMRIESAGAVLGRAEAVSARALASLDTLFGMVAGRVGQDIPCYFAKGRGHDEEIAEASAHWGFTMVKHGSTVETDSVILEVRDIAPLPASSRP